MSTTIRAGPGPDPNSATLSVAVTVADRVPIFEHARARARTGAQNSTGEARGPPRDNLFVIFVRRDDAGSAAVGQRFLTEGRASTKEASLEAPRRISAEIDAHEHNTPPEP